MKYKLALRQAFQDWQEKHTDELHEHRLSKNTSEFWKTWNRKCHKSCISNICVNGESLHCISSLFMHHPIARRLAAVCSVLLLLKIMYYLLLVMVVWILRFRLITLIHPY